MKSVLDRVDKKASEERTELDLNKWGLGSLRGVVPTRK